MIKIGMLGCGNIGGAILRGWAINPVLADRISLYAYDHDPAICACKEGSVTSLCSAAELVREADWLVLAVKPQQLADVLIDIKNELDSSKLLISVAAGIAISRIKEFCGRKSPVVRVMPNMPAMVGQGVFGLCFDDPVVTVEQQSAIEELFNALGATLNMPEKKFNAFTAISGGGPAYICYFLESLVEAGVYMGISRHEALAVVLAMTKGSVALVEKTGLSMSRLIEQVCSPGGTTIEAIAHFERTGVRGHIIDGLSLAVEKGKKLG